jgi:hypothetical protein
MFFKVFPLVSASDSIVIPLGREQLTESQLAIREPHSDFNIPRAAKMPPQDPSASAISAKLSAKSQPQLTKPRRVASIDSPPSLNKEQNRTRKRR